MKPFKQVLATLTGGLLVLGTSAADVPAHPLHVLYLGPATTGNAGGGFPRNGDGGRANYVYLPGQTLAPEAIYFDCRADVSDLTDAYLKHFDAVVQVTPETALGAPQQKLLEGFKQAGHGVIKLADGKRPEDADLRKAFRSIVAQTGRGMWIRNRGS